jgi:hypothetical protein
VIAETIEAGKVGQQRRDKMPPDVNSIEIKSP